MVTHVPTFDGFDQNNKLRQYSRRRHCYTKRRADDNDDLSRHDTFTSPSITLPPLFFFLLPLLLCLFFLLLVFGLFHFLSSDSTDAGRRTSTQPYRPPLRILPDVPAIYIHTYIHVFIYTYTYAFIYYSCHIYSYIHVCINVNSLAYLPSKAHT